jgi:hypothetical protein
MPGRKEGGKEDWFEDFLTPDEIRQWAERQIKEATKALELRTKEVTEIAKAYSAGEITPEKADEMHSRYYHRWGEALAGVTLGDGMKTDEQLLAEIDKAAGPFTTPRENYDHTRRLRGGNPSGGKSRHR